MTRLADLTTLRLGGPAGRIVEATTEAELIEAAQLPGILVVGGGSNLVVADEGFPGTVVLVRNRGVQSDGELVTAQAGEVWDDVVAWTLAHGLSGLEALSGIPGSVGATPIQNVGAYGAEVADVVAEVRTWDRVLKGVRRFTPEQMGFAYRTSKLKKDPDRHVVLAVTFRLSRDGLSAPVRYAELARALGVELGERVPAADVREAVLELRRGKGMVLAPPDATEADHDTWSAGSFFTNPVVDPAGRALPEGAPTYPQPDGRVKTSAAWLIEHAGFGKGYGNAAVSLSTKHTLALTNRGSGTTAALLALAAEVRDGVQEAFGIRLEPEPVLVGCSL